MWDEFCKLNIERFYKLNTSQTFVSHLLMKDDILDLIKCIVNARVHKSNKESIKHEKSAETNHSNVNEELGLTKFYARNDDFNHYCSSNLKFGNPYFLHRVYEHFTSENVYKNTPNKYEVHQVLKPDKKYQL